jgi:glycerophosphoryl diester phosphodiesterase
MKMSVKHLPTYNSTWLRHLLIITLITYSFACGSNSPERIRLVNQKRKIALVAHRGASDVAPENTLAAVRKALQTPAEFIEIDIHQTRDSQVVLMHDASIDRTTNGEGYISDLTLDEIKKLDAGSWFDSTYRNERVPTLEEVLQLVKGQKKLLIEIKKGPEYYSNIENLTLALIRKHNAGNWCVIQSFYDPVLQKIWKNEFAVTTHKLIIGKMPWLPLYFDHGLRWGSFDKYYRASAINVNQYFATKSFIRHVHNNGFKTFVWTLDDPKAINYVIERGADGVFSNKTSSLLVE